MRIWEREKQHYRPAREFEVSGNDHQHIAESEEEAAQKQPQDRPVVRLLRLHEVTGIHIGRAFVHRKPIEQRGHYHQCDAHGHQIPKEAAHIRHQAAYKRLQPCAGGNHYGDEDDTVEEDAKEVG